MVEEGHPDYIEQAINVVLRKRRHQHQDLRQGRAADGRRIHRRGAARRASPRSWKRALPAGVDLVAVARQARGLDRAQARGAAAHRRALPQRPPGFCTGCPERPVFSAIKLVERELGPMHVAADIGCHTFATLPPFNIGNSVLGYGMRLASAAAVGAQSRPSASSAIMGDGGFWHNGTHHRRRLATCSTRATACWSIMNNGYTSATGQQYMPSTRPAAAAPRPAWTSSRRCARWASNGCARCAATASASMVATLKRGDDAPPSAGSR